MKRRVRLEERDMSFAPDKVTHAFSFHRLMIYANPGLLSSIHYTPPEDILTRTNHTLLDSSGREKVRVSERDTEENG